MIDEKPKAQSDCFDQGHKTWSKAKPEQNFISLDNVLFLKKKNKKKYRNFRICQLVKK